MSLSRPVTFPLLKLPWLCIKCVLHNSDEFILIYFATISNRTRITVKSSNYPLKDIGIHLNGSKKICMGNKKFWYFTSFTGHMYGSGFPLVLQKNSQPFLTSEHLKSWMGPHLHSRTTGDTLDALKMGIHFMIDVFGCKIGRFYVEGNKHSELFGLGISSVKELVIRNPGPDNPRYLLENIKFTDSCVFDVRMPDYFYCNPQIFKCRKLFFGLKGSADWVTLELLCQFDVSQLTFLYHRFSVEDIVSYVTYWFNSENTKLEYVQFEFNNPISLGGVKIDHLNPMPFCEKRRNRCPFAEKWKGTDISSEMDILRHDGLLATLFVKHTSVIFYIWHKRFPDVAEYNQSKLSIRFDGLYRVRPNYCNYF